MAKVKANKTPLVRVSKRTDISGWKALGIRAIAFVAALVVGGIVTAILVEGNPFKFYSYLFTGTFGTPRRIWKLLQDLAMLLLISLAVTPAFKMRFWNIGAEGQALVGVLAAGAMIYYIGDSVPNGVLILIMAAAAIVAGIIWAVIPGIFKAYFNTNETLFTLMMNYVAMCLVNYFINIWVTSGSGVLGVLADGHFPVIGNQPQILTVIIVAVITVLVAIYLSRSKHGYELSVVGESENTARYIGINVKKVIIRTMVLSGALCGMVGLLLVGGIHYTVTADLVGGTGFTAILVSWLAKFNPIYMVATSFLVTFLNQGATFAADAYRLGGSFSDIIVGLFFFAIIACEFFINYKVSFNLKSKKNEAKKAEDAVESEVKEEVQG
ncbi:MAG: ABC transporter permease [Clostridia bacterium]|nr:ABC transporter permease [Clostridia bacterium]